jgi:lipid-A-disaccharide synthase-like uncharacterized protein
MAIYPFLILLPTELRTMELKIHDLLVFSLGFLAQLLFFSRNIVQWFKSETAGKVLSPVLYWQISLMASILMLIYGILRIDFAILMGQFITFFIYIRNLQLQHAWKKIPFSFRISISIMPLLCLVWLLYSGKFSLAYFNGEEGMLKWVLYFGILAQLVFTFRFVFQWLVSEKNKASGIPLGFWIFSVTGAIMTIIYAIIRRDPVLLLSNLGGLAMYVRNLFLHFTGKGLFKFLPNRCFRE